MGSPGSVEGVANFDLVIFDLDGTLVASEAIAEAVVARVVNRELPFSMSPAEVNQRYRGQTVENMLEDLARRHGSPLSEAFLLALAQEYRNALETELQATDGAEDLLIQLAKAGVGVSVASNGESAMVRNSLRLTGIETYFADAVFGVDVVDNPKPAPDLFLTAASFMNVAPERSIVVEDSVLGARAGLAAGMTTVGFVGNHPEGVPLLEALGIPVLQHMDEIRRLVLDD